MKRYFVAAAIAASAVLGTTPLSAAGIMDSFRFEFFGAAPDFQIGSDTYTHHTDFRHHGDYYRSHGYGDPQRNTSCRETSVQAEDGRTIQRISCRGRGGLSAVPLR